MSCLCITISTNKPCKMTVMATPDVCIFHMRQFQQNGFNTVAQWNAYARKEYHGVTGRFFRTKRINQEIWEDPAYDVNGVRKIYDISGKPVSRIVEDDFTHGPMGEIVYRHFVNGKLHSESISEPAIVRKYPDGSEIVDHYTLGKKGLFKSPDRIWYDAYGNRIK